MNREGYGDIPEQESSEVKAQARAWDVARQPAFLVRISYSWRKLWRLDLTFDQSGSPRLHKATLTKGPFCRGEETVPPRQLSQSRPWFAKVPKSQN
jgi:hypothetical protein